jgi:hypothetical protein
MEMHCTYAAVLIMGMCAVLIVIQEGIANLTDADLEAMGITLAGHRNRILKNLPGGVGPGRSRLYTGDDFGLNSVIGTMRTMKFELEDAVEEAVRSPTRILSYVARGRGGAGCACPAPPAAARPSPPPPASLVMFIWHVEGCPHCPPVCSHASGGRRLAPTHPRTAHQFGRRRLCPSLVER